MSIIEYAKKTLESLTGIGRPSPPALTALVRRRKAHCLRFADDGETPNNRHWPLLLYRSPVRVDADYDPAAVFEVLFTRNGWRDSWRNGIFPFRHFHTGTHEVLGIARGRATVELGGASGRKLTVKAGDVLVLPAGTGHRRLAASRDLLVVGAYPANGRYDEPKPGEIDHAEAVRTIARVKRPARDPVYGRDGPLVQLWTRPARRTRANSRHTRRI